jgi:hypothetical protein
MSSATEAASSVPLGGCTGRPGSICSSASKPCGGTGGSAILGAAFAVRGVSTVLGVAFAAGWVSTGLGAAFAARRGRAFVADSVGVVVSRLA